MVIHVLDQSFNLVGVVDDYISVIWRPAYYDIGDFELYINATSEAIKLLNEGYYLVRDRDIFMDESGNVTYSNVMVLKNIKLNTDVEEGDHLTYTGRELKFLLSQRIVWTQTTLSGTAEAGIRRLVTENAISPADNKRVIPALTLGASAGLSDSIDKQVTGESLAQTIIDICKAYGYGWEVYIYNKSMVFIVYKGVNRSYNQSENPFVVFSDDFDNILNSEYERNSENYANCTLIGGEGEGIARTFTTVGNTYTGLNRYEIFTDARDISQNKGSENEIDVTTYLSLLNERGLENLAPLSVTEGFTGEVLNNVNYKYGEDYYLGDTVTVINKYGISKDVMVLSAIESVDESGTKLIPQFNI